VLSLHHCGGGVHDGVDVGMVNEYRVDEPIIGHVA
jgi:hypothetical protein